KARRSLPSGVTISWGRNSRRQVASKGDEGPDALDDSEGPRTCEKAVAARERAAKSEECNEVPAARFARVHRHHEGHGNDAVDRDGHSAQHLFADVATPSCPHGS